MEGFCEVKSIVSTSFDTGQKQDIFYENIMLTIMNERAFSSGLIDERTRDAVRKEIRINGSSDKNTCFVH